MGTEIREGGAGAGALGLVCPIPWCGRAVLQYATSSRSTRRSCPSPRTRT